MVEATGGPVGTRWSAIEPGSAIEQAFLDVPRDPDDPAGPTVTLALTRLLAADPARRRGVLVILHGGPGGNNGLGRHTPAEFAGTGLHAVYDLVGMDPRGFGDSTFLPRVKAEEKAPFDSRPPDAAFPALVADMRAREDGCVAGGGELRRHVTTRNVVADLDRVRELLGEERLSVLGYAFGTAVAAAYSTLHPTRVDRMVLDSSVNPRWGWREQFMAQARAIRDNGEAWAAWVGARHGRFGLGRGRDAVVATVEDVCRGLEELAGGPRLRSVLDGILGNQTAPRPGWDELADMVAALVAAVADGDAGRAAELLYAGNAWRPGDGGFELQEGVLEAVTSEDDWPRDLETYYRDMREYRDRYPWGYGVFRAMPWVATFSDNTPTLPPVRTGHRGQPRGLVVQADGDTLNHREGAETMARVLDHRLCLVTDSGDHEIYHRSGYPEVDRIVEDYLVRGVLPSEPVVRVPGKSRPDVPADDTAANTAGDALTAR